MAPERRRKREGLIEKWGEADDRMDRDKGEDRAAKCLFLCQVPLRKLQLRSGKELWEGRFC